jgi:hypothetical protein
MLIVVSFKDSFQDLKIGFLPGIEFIFAHRQAMHYRGGAVILGSAFDGQQGEPAQQGQIAFGQCGDGGRDGADFIF